MSSNSFDTEKEVLEEVPRSDTAVVLDGNKAFNSEETRLVFESEELPKAQEIQLEVTDAQYDAIMYPANENEVLRIRAGPGSGKTFTLVARIARLLEDGMDPEEILVLSMANRSVDSLRDSLARIVGSVMAEKINISTFHSFCALLIDEEGSLDSAYVRARVFDIQSWRRMISFFLGKLVRLHGQKINGSVTSAKLDRAVSDIISGRMSLDDACELHKINPKYVSELIHYLRLKGLIRFDELIRDAVKLMHQSREALKSAWDRHSDELSAGIHHSLRLSRTKAVFVDEFQDVYPALVSVVKAIVAHPTMGLPGSLMKHLTITGDPNQCIYEFLGSKADDMDNLSTALPSMRFVDKTLADSFRCTESILKAAAEACPGTSPMRLSSMRTKSASRKPFIVTSESLSEELGAFADEITRLISKTDGSVRKKDIAVLTRTNDLASQMQMLLKTRGIPSFKLTPINHWVNSRFHVMKDILSVISGDPGSSLSLLAVLSHFDKFPRAKSRLSALFNESMQQVQTNDENLLENYLMELLSGWPGESSPLTSLYKKHPSVCKAMAEFLNQVQHEREILLSIHQESPMAYGPQELCLCLSRISKIGDISKYLEVSRDQDTVSQYEILKSFNDSVHLAYENFSKLLEQNSISFIDYFVQNYDAEVPNDTEDSVKLSTIHAAKGLEFPVVFIPGLTKYGSSWNSVLGSDEADEDYLTQRADPSSRLSATSRLLYVGLTRARDLAYIGVSFPFKNLLRSTRHNFTEKSGETTRQTDNIFCKTQSSSMLNGIDRAEALAKRHGKQEISGLNATRAPILSRNNNALSTVLPQVGAAHRNFSTSVRVCLAKMTNRERLLTWLRVVEHQRDTGHWATGNRLTIYTTCIRRSANRLFIPRLL